MEYASKSGLKLLFGNGLKLAVAAIGLCAATAQAKPFTYAFTIGYDHVDSTAAFGSSAILDVTVDNGGNSNVAQSYTWNDIAYLNVSTSGGYFSLATVYPPAYLQIYNTTLSSSHKTDNTSLFNTDQSGALASWVATGLNEQFIQYKSDYRNNYSIELGAGAVYGLTLFHAYYAPYCQQGYCYSETAYTKTLNTGLSGALIANPLYLQVIPLPGSWIMLGSGLVMMSLRRRKGGAQVLRKV